MTVQACAYSVTIPDDESAADDPSLARPAGRASMEDSSWGDQLSEVGTVQHSDAMLGSCARDGAWSNRTKNIRLDALLR